MGVRKQLSVTMDDRPGTLATMCSAFGKKGVNILALMSTGREGKSLVRLIADKGAAAKRTLQEIGYSYTEEEVLATKLQNRPGTLAAVAQKLGDAGANIDYAYYGAEPGSTQVLVILSVSDLEQAKKVVK
jgi:hypothetical protein